MAHLLVVGDNLGFVTLLRGVLTAAGHRVAIATNDNNALTSVMAHMPDVLILCPRDLVRTEWTFIEQLRFKMKITVLPVIALVESDDAAMGEWAHALNIARVVIHKGKPIGELLAILEQAINTELG